MPALNVWRVSNWSGSSGNLFRTDRFDNKII